MAGNHDLLEAQVERLAGRLDELSRRLDYLYSYLGIPSREPAAGSTSEHLQDSAQEGILHWAASASLLPGVSIVCFLLVVALILRTLTDNNVLDTRTGSIMGMGYAGALILTGHLRCKKGDTLSSVFLVCGTLLICSVVVESYQRFHSLPSSGAYAVLLAVGLGTSFTGFRFSKEVPAAVGLLGMCTASATLEFPNPFFPPLACILIIANILGFALRGLKGFSWIRWTVFLITLFVMTYWSGKLTIALGRKDQEFPGFLALSWFLPLLGCFSLLYPALCLLETLREKSRGISRFVAIVPGLTGLWAFWAAYQVLEAWGRSARILGLTGLFLGGAYLCAAHWLGRRALAHGRGTNSFALGSCLLIGVSLPLLTESGFFALPFVSGLALSLFLLSEVWKSGGVRLTSYLMQVYAATATALLLWGKTQSPHLATQLLLGGLVSFAGALHYGWCLKKAPAHDSSVFFSRYDKQDRTAILNLAGSLLSGFFVLRAAVEEVLHLLPADFQNSFQCAQSVLVNLIAAVLMSYAFFKIDQAARNLAVVLTLIGAVKVFMFDLLQARGVPLVLSVFSFGLAVLLESILLGRWQKASELPNRSCLSKPQGSGE